MIDRRTFLGTIGVALAALALGARPMRLFAAVPATAPVGGLPAGLHLVDGWVLTSADLASIADHAR